MQQCALPVITKTTFWQFCGFVATVHHVPKCMNFHKVIVHELPQSHCGDNLEGTLFS